MRSGKFPAKINVSEEHHHMVRLYMVHRRLPNMQIALAKMIEAVMEAEGTYTYQLPKELGEDGNGERKAV